MINSSGFYDSDIFKIVQDISLMVYGSFEHNFRGHAKAV